MALLIEQLKLSFASSSGVEVMLKPEKVVLWLKTLKCFNVFTCLHI